MALIDKLTSIADAIRGKTGGTALLTLDDMAAAITGITSGGGGSIPSATKKDVNFYDYDGTLLYGYTVAEAAALTELPALPTHEGLVCQGWNWTLDGIKAMGRAVDVGVMYITDDGKTRVYIRLEDGRTSPMLGCCPNGTVTVDWGDGTTPDVLTGTSTITVKWTPTHEYAAPGDYVISLTVDGTMGLYGSSSINQYSGFLRYSSGADSRNRTYQNSVQRIEIGGSVTSIGNYAFAGCYSLASITIPDGVTSIGSNAFFNCYSLASVIIPDSVTSIGNDAFSNCYSLASITIPNSVTSIGGNVFFDCYSLASVIIPDSVTSISDYAFAGCYSLASITIPDGVTSIGSNAFLSCYSLASITIPNSVTSIGGNAFRNCYSLASVIIPDSVTSIGNYAFSNCYGVRYYDFACHTAVPTLSGTNAFQNIAADCEIRVPAALADEWKAATNWATYANYIVGI